MVIVFKIKGMLCLKVVLVKIFGVLGYINFCNLIGVILNGVLYFCLNILVFIFDLRCWVKY